MGSAAVVKQGVNRLLKHPLLIAKNDLGGLDVYQLLQTVVAVDHPPVKIVQVGGCEAAALQGHQGSKVGRNNRQHTHNHPFRSVLRLPEGLNYP